MTYLQRGKRNFISNVCSIITCTEDKVDWKQKLSGWQNKNEKRDGENN